MAREGMLLGFDVGSSSIKAALLDAATGRLAWPSAASPERELAISAPRPGWAEQDPGGLVGARGAGRACAALRRRDRSTACGRSASSYQMHGLVCVDRPAGCCGRPSSGATAGRWPSGEAAFAALGPERCLRRLLNSPGQLHRLEAGVGQGERAGGVRADPPVMLPGRLHRAAHDRRNAHHRLRAFRGRSCGISQREQAARFVLEHYGIPRALIPRYRARPSRAQGRLTAAAAARAGPAGRACPVTYRAGDQPNNAFSLNVLEPGEIAATAGTSGRRLRGGGPRLPTTRPSRVNTFVHVNHTADRPRYGVLLCVNGTGILNSWLRASARQGGLSLRRDERAGGPGARRLPTASWCSRSATARSGRWRTATPAPRSAASTSTGTAGRTCCARPRKASCSRSPTGWRSCAAWASCPRTVRAGHANMFLSPLFASHFATVSGLPGRAVRHRRRTGRGARRRGRRGDLRGVRRGVHRPRRGEDRGTRSRPRGPLRGSRGPLGRGAGAGASLIDGHSPRIFTVRGFTCSFRSSVRVSNPSRSTASIFPWSMVSSRVQDWKKSPGRRSRTR